MIESVMRRIRALDVIERRIERERRQIMLTHVRRRFKARRQLD